MTSWDEYDISGPSTIRLSKDKGHHYKIISLPQPDVCGVSGSDQDTTFFVVCPSVFTNQPSYIYRINGSDFPPVGVEEYELGPNVTIAPNPVTDILHVSVTDGEIARVEMFDAFGRNIPVGANNHSPLQTTINTSKLPSGVYVLRITLRDGGVRTTKVVKR